MQRRENYLYVGMDLHKDTHTAVLLNCWNEKLDVMVIENKPSEFNKLAKKVDKAAFRLNLSPIYGLENAYGYGRSLAVWLIEKGYTVKDVNPSLAYDQRKSAPMMKKNDEHELNRNWHTPSRLEGYLCKKHALELKEMLVQKKGIVKNPDMRHHCLICGKYQDRVIIDYPSVGYFCDQDIEEEVKK